MPEESGVGGLGLSSASTDRSKWTVFQSVIAAVTRLSPPAR